MTPLRVATAQLPAIDDSDDKIFTTPDAVIMLDGASAFVPVPVPATTYADHLGSYLRDTLTADPQADLASALAEGIRDTTSALDLRPGKSPSSTVTIARQINDGLDLLILGDNLVVLPDGVITDERMDQLDLAPRRKYRERLAAGFGYDAEHRTLLRELQTQQAQQRNRDGGYWIAETDPSAAAHAITAQRRVADAPWAILATDGAYNTLEHLSLAHWHDMPKASPHDLAMLLRQCETWEASNDPAGRALPRSKRHDDKSLAVVDIRTGSYSERAV